MASGWPGGVRLPLARSGKSLYGLAIAKNFGPDDSNPLDKDLPNTRPGRDSVCYTSVAQT